MNTESLILSFLDSLRDSLPAGTTVRTPGGDEDPVYPAVIVSWERRPSSDGGHDDFRGTRENQTGGTDTVYHHYYEMEFRCEIRADDEREVIQLSDALDGLVSKYGRQPAAFDVHTYEWGSGRVRARPNYLMAPDWYEAIQPVSCKFVTEEVDTDVPTLDTISYNITIGLN